MPLLKIIICVPGSLRLEVILESRASQAAWHGNESAKDIDKN